MCVQFSLEIKSKIIPKLIFYGAKNLKEKNQGKFMGLVQALLSQIGKQKYFKCRTYCYNTLRVHEEMKSRNRKFTSSMGHQQTGEEGIRGCSKFNT